LNINNINIFPLKHSLTFIAPQTIQEKSVLNSSLHLSAVALSDNSISPYCLPHLPIQIQPLFPQLISGRAEEAAASLFFISFLPAVLSRLWPLPNLGGFGCRPSIGSPENARGFPLHKFRLSLNGRQAAADSLSAVSSFPSSFP
jgi:hypothetical protein